MGTGTKKVGSAGRFREKYGKTVRGRVAKIEEKQRQKQVCPYCKKPKLQRTSKAIWTCAFCDRTFTSRTYYVE